MATTPGAGMMYMNANPDVFKEYEKQVKAGTPVTADAFAQQHYNTYGVNEGRQGVGGLAAAAPQAATPAPAPTPVAAPPAAGIAGAAAKVQTGPDVLSNPIAYLTAPENKDLMAAARATGTIGISQSSKSFQVVIFRQAK